MPRIAVISDVHGNLAALEAVLERFRPLQPDALVAAGDFMGGPQVDAIVDIMRTLGPHAVSGNTDASLIDHYRGRAPEFERIAPKFAVARWAARHVSVGALQWLESLPEQRVVAIPATDAIRVVHGSPRSNREPLRPSTDAATLDAILADVPEPVLICGHTHVPMVLRLGRHLIVNPGAVSAPLDGQVGAQYALLTCKAGEWSAELSLVPYDAHPTREAYESSGLLEEGGPLARALLLAAETGVYLYDAFLAHAESVAREMGMSTEPFVPEEAWTAAEASFDWGRAGGRRNHG